nr:DEAD-box ATP-dependent RNA helicase 38-like [Ipomoea batatas]
MESKDNRVIGVEQHIETEEPGVKNDPRAQEAGSKMVAYEQAQLRVESLASTDQLSFVLKAPGTFSCAYGSRKSIISGGRIDIHSSTDLRALEGKSSESLYAICQSACCAMMDEKMTMFRELPKSHNNVDAIREQAKTSEVDGHPVTDEREKLKESDVVELAKAHFEANVAKAKVEVARSSVEAADLKALQGSKEFQKAVEEYIDQHATELLDKFFQTEEGKARIIQEGKDAYSLGRQAMQQKIYDILGRRAGFDFNEWGLPKMAPDLLEKK